MGNLEQTIRGRPWAIGLAALLALVLTACLPEGTRVPESPLLASLERKSGLIVYTGTDGNIYTINQAGGKQSALTIDGGVVDEASGERVVYELPVWSPDASQIAFARLVITEQALQEATILIADPDGENRREAITTDDQIPIYLYWSPDGEQLTFISTSDLSASNLVLQIAPADGSRVDVLDVGQPYYWAWSPDSANLLVHAGGDTAADGRLSFLNPQDGVLENRLDVHPWTFNAPAWSPQGNQLLMAIRPEPNASRGVLALTGLDGQVEQELAEFENSVAFAWSPDGKRIAYISGRPELPDNTIGPLTVVDPDKPDEALTPPEDENVLAFFWAPDGRRLAYFEPVLIMPSALQAEAGTPAAGDGSAPTPSPTQAAPGTEEQPVLFLRLRVMNTRTGDTRNVISFQPTDDFYGMLLNFDQYQHSATIWSPDGENLVIAGLGQDGTPAIWVLAASGNLSPRFVANGRVGFWSFK
jgi:TolB protein